MRPVVFDDCFGWLHPTGGHQGVVLCNPFGYDALCTHRGWRRLAERIAASGMPVLRFDYPGAGDSLGSEEEPDRVEACIESIVAAVRHLRQSTGVTQVSLCGLRLGATLAALAAQRLGDVEGLVLLSPAVSGRNYVRELRAHRQSWMSTPAGMSAEPIPDSAAYVEAFGFGLHGDDIGRLASIDLLADTTAPARRVLLLDASDRSRATALVEHYGSNGVPVTRRAFDEADRFLIEALYSEEPIEAFSAVTQWLGGQPPPRGAAEPMTPPPCGAAASLAEDAPALRLEQHGAVERPVIFGPYFGIYCQPDVPRAGAPAVLFFNTGASHHIGDGRIFVLFARQLAAQGIASLRMDLGGLGDSTPTAQAVTLDTIYSEQSCTDAMAGADWLISNGHPGIVTFGVCGGAFVGLHACAAHPRIVGSFGVNLQKFIWDGEARTPGTTGLASTRVLRRSALSLEKWKRVLRGESSLTRTLRGLAQRVGRSMLLRVVERVEGATGLVLMPSEVQRLLQRVHAKGAEVRLVYGEYDLGLDELKIQFGSTLRGLRRFPRVRAATLPKLDHALFTAQSREAAVADAQNWLFERFVATRPLASSNVCPRTDSNDAVLFQ
ncbi:serine aminopeptidase domain-containing protein [Paraburkholderia phenazinium]|jgi:pimeloyl-ACP methyl ester carboxylesterase|uniref:Serine aminopeptidase, S33 n=1 Tax=Paraburkholderia phenazinium TaxID=60549 RepID=A0A1G8EQQ6_9BURK|nr:alpha/beta hydrolase [Paraburkholderia phenazinium]SDH72206.1 Serine aminopeptidase, S33 [Paraburkholderia phenazinium]